MTMAGERGRTRATSTAVVEAIAAYLETDPMDLVHPLYDVIDPDALDGLFPTDATGDGPTDTTVEFCYDGCRVRVSGGGAVEVSPLPVE